MSEIRRKKSSEAKKLVDARRSWLIGASPALNCILLWEMYCRSEGIKEHTDDSFTTLILTGPTNIDVN